MSGGSLNKSCGECGRGFGSDNEGWFGLLTTLSTTAQRGHRRERVPRKVILLKPESWKETSGSSLRMSYPYTFLEKLTSEMLF